MNQHLGILLSICIFTAVVYCIVKYDGAFKKETKK